MTDEPPVIDAEAGPSDIRDSDTRPVVAGVLLAAGTSTRYGTENKLIAKIDGTPVVRHATTALLESLVDSVLVVTGHEATMVEAALSELPVSFVHNSTYETGQATSVRTAMDALPEGVDAVVIALGDMPFVTPDSIDLLVDAYAGDAATALAAGYQGERGNPVLFDRTHFDRLRSLTGDAGGRDILLDPATDAAIIETGDPGVRRDVDVPQDLE